MLKIHTSDGETHKIDLQDENQAINLIKKLSHDDFQMTINGMSLVEYHSTSKCQNCGCKSEKPIGVQYSVARPLGFKKMFFTTESIKPNGRVKGSEKIIMFIDDVRLTVTAHMSQPAIRISLTKIGEQKFNPLKNLSKI